MSYKSIGTTEASVGGGGAPRRAIRVNRGSCLCAVVTNELFFGSHEDAHALAERVESGRTFLAIQHGHHS